MTVPILERQKGTVDKDALLGRLLWYSVPMATCLDPKVVGQALKDVGLTRRVPSPPSESDVFRRVTSVERKGIPVDGTDDQFENLLVRPVNAKRDNILLRRVVVETVDPSGHQLSYDQVVDIEFTYDATRIPNVGVMRVEWLAEFSRWTHPRAGQLVEEIRFEFDKFKGMLNESKMRGWIKQTIIEMGAVAVRPTGGIYFLEERFAGNVEALEEFINAHFPPGADCHSLEIPDNRKQREMIKRAIEAETTGAIEAMMTRVNEIKTTGTGLTPKQHLKMVQEVKALEKKMGAYSKLLEADLKGIRLRTGILKGMVSGITPTVGN